MAKKKTYIDKENFKCIHTDKIYKNKCLINCFFSF